MDDTSSGAQATLADGPPPAMPDADRPALMGEPDAAGSDPPGANGANRSPDLPTLGVTDAPDPYAATIAGETPSAGAGLSEPRADGGPDLEFIVGSQATGGPPADLGVTMDSNEPPMARGRAVPAIPGYEILGELGRGGMGVVYEARQIRLHRPCALKMILAGDHASPESSLRFLAEAETVARLRHPNVVQIHSLGDHEGQPYFELEYVEGGGLAQRLDGTPWPSRQAARLVETLARAMAEAHRLGIVHRDLKPANVLLTAEDVPKISDFGLAKSLEADSSLTQSGTILGTPSYMAPEQAEGKNKDVGPAADVYALGAILYELLTGRPPFKAATVLLTLVQVRSAEPVPPSRLQPGLPRDAETIALKCLQKDPAKRYESAGALAEDLRRFQAGESILARRTGALERTWRWCKRNPVMAGAVGSAAAALVAVAVLAVLYADRQVRYAREQARATAQITGLARDLDEERQDLKLSLAESNRRLAVFNLERGRSACEQGKVGPGLLWMVESLRAATAAGDPAWQRAARANLSVWRRDYPKLRAVFSHGGIVSSVAFSPDGKTILIGGDKSAQLWDAATGRPLGQPFEHQYSVRAVAFSPDGRTALTGSEDHTARLWEAATGRPLGQPLEHQGWVSAVAFSPDGKIVLTGGDYTAKLWDAATSRPLGQPLDHQNWVNAVAFSPDGRTALTGSDDKTAKLWDAASGRLLGQPLEHQDIVRAVAFSPDGRTALTGSDDKMARLWDAASGRLLGQPLEHQNSVRAVAFSPDGRTALTGSEDHTARLWDAATGRPLGQPLEHQDIVRTVAFSPDGRTILTGSEDHTVRLWDAATGQPIGRPLDHPDSVNAAALSPDGKTILTGSLDNTTRRWEAATGRPLGQPLGHQYSIGVIAFSPDGKAVLTGGDHTARLWDAATGRPLGQPLQHQGRVNDVAFSPDGKAVLTGSEDHTARLWDAATGRPLGRPLEHQYSVHAVAFSPDGRTVLTGSEDHTARLWDAATGRPLGRPLQHQAGISAVAFSPDGKRILTGSEDKTARLWDTATGQSLGQPLPHPNWVLAVAFSSDGQTVLTGCLDSKARLWDVATGQPVGRPLGEHRNGVDTVAFSSDGSTILTKSQDGTVRLRDTAELPDDLPRLEAWVSVLTGLELDEGGVVHVLNATTWQQRRESLNQLGGPPDSGGDRLLDPVIFGLDPTARARSLMERGREAEAAFSEAVAARPLNTPIRLERGRFYAARSQPEKAATDFAQILELMPENRHWDSSRSHLILDLARWDRAFARLLELRPQDGHLWICRGRYYALRSRWDQAAADYARGIASAPPDSEEWFEHACLRWLVGDREGYRTFVHGIRERAGETNDPLVAYVLARSCNLSPESVVEPDQVIRWAERAVTSTKNAWYLHALGVAHYRAGHFDEAIRRLEESIAGGWGEEGKAQNQLVLAMVSRRQGHTANARALLNEVVRWWNKVEATRTDGAVSLRATDWLSLQVLRREAEALILDDPIFPADVFAR